jgi:hypothetical protein
MKENLNGGFWLTVTASILVLTPFISLANYLNHKRNETQEENSALENEVTAEQNYQVGEQVTLPARLGSAPQKYSVNKNSDGSYCFTPETQRAESDYNTGR